MNENIHVRDAIVGGLHVRDAIVGGLHAREDAETGAREIVGIAVPWDTDAEIRDWFGHYIERFERGAVQDSDDALLYWRHTEPIGKITANRDTDDGWEITATISKTPRGDEAYQLVKDGVIREFSIGFIPLDHREEVVDEITVITRTRVLVRETSLVPFGAYGANAPVSQVREDGHHHQEGTPDMDPETITRADLDEIRDTLGNDLRALQVEIADRAETAHADHFRSIGDMVKQIAAGDETAIRVYEGAVSGETALTDSWLVKLQEKYAARQTVVQTFSRGTLGAIGMNVDIIRELADTTDVDEQVDEGDDLAFGKVTFTNGSTAVRTIGGWSSQSRQAIERSSLPVVNRTFSALVRRLHRRQEIIARSVLNGAVAADGLGAGDGGTALAEVVGDMTTQDGIVAAVLDLAEHFEDNDLALDGVFVDKATFLAMYGVEATGRVLQITGAPTDKVGTVSVKTASGEVADLTFKMLPNAAASTIVGYDSEAIETLSPGAMPWRLQNDNIVNLTHDMSVYSYFAAYDAMRAGLVKIVAA